MQPSYGSTEYGTELKPRESMRLCVEILKIGGLLHTRNMSHRDTILYNVRKTLVLLVYYSLTISVYVYLFVAWGSFNDMIESVSYSISLTVIALKMYVIMFRSDEVQHVVKTVQENFFIHGTELSTENRNIIKNTMKLAKKITVAYATMQASATAVFLFGPLTSFSVMLQTHNATNISSATSVYDRKLPLQLWFPLDLTRSPRFEIAYTYLVLTALMNLWNIVGIEAFCMTTFIYLTGQFELLCDSIRNASEKVKYRLDERQHSTPDSDGINKRLEFTSDKKIKIQYSKANVDSVISAKGKVNLIYITHKTYIKHAPLHIFSSDFLRVFFVV
jgi:hypothetical protein